MPFLIDGHNLIGQTPDLQLDDPDDEQKLIVLLRGYLARVKKSGVVIFDRGSLAAPKNLSSRRLSVRFARLPRTADDLISDWLHKERNPQGLTVVTSDGRLAHLAQQAGASVIDSAAFAREMLAAPARPSQKETGLRPEQVAEWEREFKRRR